MCTATGLYYGGEQPLGTAGTPREQEGGGLPALGLNIEHGVQQNIKGAALLSWSVFSKRWNKLQIT